MLSDRLTLNSLDRSSVMVGQYALKLLDSSDISSLELSIIPFKTHF